MTAHACAPQRLQKWLCLHPRMIVTRAGNHCCHELSWPQAVAFRAWIAHCLPIPRIFGEGRRPERFAGAGSARPVQVLSRCATGYRRPFVITREQSCRARSAPRRRSLDCCRQGPRSRRRRSALPAAQAVIAAVGFRRPPRLADHRAELGAVAGEAGERPGPPLPVPGTCARAKSDELAPGTAKLSTFV